MSSIPWELDDRTRRSLADPLFDIARRLQLRGESLIIEQRLPNNRWTRAAGACFSTCVCGEGCFDFAPAASTQPFDGVILRKRNMANDPARDRFYNSTGTCGNNAWQEILVTIIALALLLACIVG